MNIFRITILTTTLGMFGTFRLSAAGEKMPDPREYTVEQKKFFARTRARELRRSTDITQKYEAVLDEITNGVTGSTWSMSDPEMVEALQGEKEADDLREEMLENRKALSLLKRKLASLYRDMVCDVVKNLVGDEIERKYVMIEEEKKRGLLESRFLLGLRIKYVSSQEMQRRLQQFLSSEEDSQLTPSPEFGENLG